MEKKRNTMMFMKSKGFCLVDNIDYAGSGTSCAKWVKA